MPAPSLHPNERERLTALHALHILDTPPEERFDRIVRLTQKFFNVPIALVSLVDLNRQWFKSQVGLDATELPRATSFCGHAILQNQPLIIQDALTDAHVFDNPLVTESPHIRFYAGVPLVSTTGHNLGTLCLVDFKARTFGADQIAALCDFAALAETELNAGTREQALRSVRESEKQLSLVLEASPDPIIFYDLEGRATYANAAFVSLFGWAETELLGQRVQFVPEAEQLKTQRATQQLFRDQKIKGFETSRFTKDGRLIAVDINAALILDEAGQATGSIVMFRDITQRLKTQSALLSSERRFRDLVQQLAVGALLFGKKGELLLQNHMASELLGPVYAEFVHGQAASFFDEDNAPLMNPLRSAFLGQSVHNIVLGFYKPDGITWLLVNAVPQKDDQGQIEQVVCSLIDVTQRKAAEQQRRHTKLLGIVATISAELNSILDPEQLLQTISSRLKEKLAFNNIYIYQLDQTGEYLEAKQHSDRKEKLSLSQNIVARAARIGAPLLDSHNLPHTASELAIPLIARGQLLAVLQVQDDQPNRFTAADIDALGTLGGQVAIALSNAVLFEQQNRTALALQQSQAQLHTVISNAELILFAINKDGICTLSEGRALQRLGLSPGEMVGRSVFQAYAGMTELLAGVERALTGEAFRTLVELSEYTFDTWYTPLYSERGEPIGTIGVSTDVTAREQAQRAIYKQRAYLRQIIDLNPNFIFAKDRSGKFTLVNRAVAEAYGTTPQALIGKTDADFNSNHEEVAHFRRDDLAVMDTLQEKFIPEEPITDSSGKHRWLQTIKRAIVDEHGKGVQVLGVATDITRRKEAEQQQVRLTKQLRAAADVAERINGILEPSVLLGEVTSLLQEHFGFYHVHIYLYNEQSNQLVMERGSGETGLLMRQRNHTIALSKKPSLVAQAGRLREMLLVNEVSECADYMANALLPDTRSEMVVPLVIGERLLGVLDVQDNHPARFGAMERDLFRTLAGQLATALENAQLFEQKQQALELTRWRLMLNEAFASELSEEQVLEEQLRLAALSERTQVRLIVMAEEGKKAVLRGGSLSESALPLMSQIEDERLFVTNNTLTDLRIDPQTRAYLSQSGWQSLLLAGEQKASAILVLSASSDFFDKHKATLYQSLAERAAQALRESRLRIATEHARAETERERTLLNSILTALPVGVHVTNREGKALRTNEIARHLLRSDTGNDYQLIEADSGAPYQESSLPRLRTLADGQSHSAEDIVLLHPDGTKINLLVQSGPLLNTAGELYGATVVLSDITPRKLIEANLRTSEARHRAILQATPDLMFRFNRDGVYLDLQAVSRTLPRLLREGEPIERSTLIGRKVTEILPPEVASKILVAIKQALYSHATQTIHYELTTEAGTIAYEARLVVSSQDEVLAYVRDITESKLASAQRQRFIKQLRTAAELTAQLTSILEPERLLQEIVTQLQNLFDFYHVHIYLLNERSQQLVIGAGSGEVGERLRQQGHAIELTREQSIVARAARSQKMILVHDVAHIDYFYRNPHLPETRSEVAIPLISRTQVIGVLDVQSKEPYAFTEGDLHTLNTLAAQIATSLQNATLFEEIQRISETRLHAVLDNVLDGILTINDQGIIESFNPAAERILGYTAQEVVGQAIPADQLIPEYKKLTEGHHESTALTRDGTDISIEIGLRSIELAAQPLIIAIIRDITQRKKAEQALRESEERFRQVAENIHEVFWISDPNQNKTIYISPAFKEIWGVESLHQNKLSLIETVHPADRGRIIAPLPTQIHGTHNQEYRIIRPDGTIRWIAEQAFPVRNSNREIYRIVGVAHDITTRKLAEAQQQHLQQLKIAAELSEQLTSILEHNRLLEAVVTRLQHHFSFYHVQIYLFDPAKQALLMEVGSGHIGQKLRQKQHQIKLDFEHSLVVQAARQRHPIVVDDVRQNPHFLPNPHLPHTRSEVALPILSAGHLLGVLDVQDNQIARFTPNDIDVLRTIAGQIATALENAHLFEQVQQNLAQTAIRFELSQALAKTQTEEQVLDTIIQQTLSYHRTLNPIKPHPNIEITISTLSQEAEKQTLIMRRQHPVDNQTISPQPGTILANSAQILNHLSQSQNLISNHIQQDKHLDSPIRQYYKSTGTNSIAQLPLTIGGQLLGIIGLASKETNRFKNEKTLYFYQSLAQQSAVALRSAQLFDHTQRTADHLRTLDRLKSEFLANMSHELRTPLNSIIGYSEIMLMGINGPLNEDMTEDMEAIRNSGQHLLRLINDILDLAKIEAGKMSLEIKELELSGLLDEIRVSHAALLHNKPVEMLIHIPPHIPPIHADRVRLNQILTNLVSNAIKFTEKGTILIQATTANQKIAISVKDQGIGISETDIPLIFAEFRQVDGSSTRRAEGTGLGLAITKHLVTMHGGTIKVESQPGQGSTFTVELPVTGPASS